VLLGVARTGSLNGAARQAGVSQQAVSARIRAMEAQTGVALVHRTPRGSALTADGAVIAEWAARLLEVAAGLDAGIAALRQDRRARLRVSASSTIAEQLLPGWLASFRPAPDIVLTAANTEQVIGHVAAGSAGIGFIEGPPRPAGLRSKVIGQDRLVVVVAPAHRWARRRALSAAELVGTPLVSWEGGSGTRDTLSAALTAALGAGAAQVPAALSVSTTAAVRAAVLAAAAPAVISEHDPGKRRWPGRWTRRPGRWLGYGPIRMVPANSSAARLTRWPVSCTWAPACQPDAIWPFMTTFPVCQLSVPVSGASKLREPAEICQSQVSGTRTALFGARLHMVWTVPGAAPPVVPSNSPGGATKCLSKVT